jgi:uncharacterized protein YidB (DUF937 family)
LTFDIRMVFSGADSSSHLSTFHLLLSMGLFDSIAGNVLGSVLGGNQDGSNPLASVIGSVMSGKADLGGSMSTVLNQSGGLDGLMQKAEQMGLGGVVGSWIGTGANQPISGDQAVSLLGQDNVQQMAQKFGIDLGQAGPLIATVLPLIIDKLTPKGTVEPGASQGAGLEQAIGGLMSGGGLTSILGSLMGGKA